jgi:hypothetical protein
MAVKPGNGGNGERDPRLDLLYRDAGREGPPAHLDAAILAAARREVGARPRALSALRRWRVPVSIAAVVVLSMSLVTLVKEEEGYGLFLRDARSPEESSTRESSARRMAESPGQPAEPARAPEARQRAAASAPEELSLRRDEAAAIAEAETARRREEQARSSTAPSAGPDAGAAPPAAAVSGLFSYQLQEPPARTEADAAKKAAPSIGTRGMSGETERPAAPQAKAKIEEYVVQDRPRPLQKAAPAPAWRGLEQEPPRKWLERLTELRKRERTREADELLAEFKRRFPDHPLPAGTE